LPGRDLIDTGKLVEVERGLEMSHIQGKNVLVTGGTGSFGKALVHRLLQEDEVKSIIVFSRDELKQFEFQEKIKSSKLKFMLGDVRDYQRLIRVTSDVDIIVHTAAMKQIPAAEYNPMEAIKTNILGAENIINSAIENSVSRVVALSTDKAANPANLYGATKLCSDKLMIAANNLAGPKGTAFSVVRYGNVLGSRGSVIPFFIEKSKEGIIPITDERMTRFWLTIESGVQFVLDSLERMHGGEIFVPKIPSFKVIDVARVVTPNVPTKVIGIRPGEKLHEVMITEDDSEYTIEFDDYYAILSPSLISNQVYKGKGKKVPEGFKFSSDNNSLWHTDETFLKVLKDSGVLA
jgi:UDP-N-acetylglucosamine 4,6-dehydratase